MKNRNADIYSTKMGQIYILFSQVVYEHKLGEVGNETTI